MNMHDVNASSLNSAEAISRAGLEPLPLRIDPYEHESLPGFLVRLAERNAFERVGWLLELARIPPGRMVVFKGDLQRLADLAAIPAKILQAMGIEEAADGNCLFRGQPIRRSHVRTRTRRFCLGCLDDAPFSRRCWDLSIVQVCPEHHIRLVERCEECGHWVSWLNPNISTCKCGFDFRKSEWQCIDPDQVQATRFLIDIFEKENISEMQPPLSELTFSGVVDLLSIIGAGVSQSNGNKSSIIGRQPDPNLYKRLHNGLQYTHEWPSRFHQLLESLHAMAPDRRGEYGLLKSFGRFHTAVTLIEDPVVKKLISEPFREFVISHSDIGLTRRRSVILAIDDRRRASLLNCVRN